MKVRINTIEARNINGRYEIVKWQPSSYFGKEEELIAKGYKKVVSPFNANEFSLQNDYHSIHSSCFEHKESCFVVAYLNWDTDAETCYIESVGERLLDMDQEERYYFFEVYKVANKIVRMLETKKEEK